MQRPASARSDPTSYFLSPADPRLPSQEHSASAHVVLKQLSSLASLLQELAIFIILFLPPFYIRLENMDKDYRHRTARHTLQLISMRSEQTQEHNIFSGKALFAKVLNPIATIQSYSSITFQTITYHSPSFPSCPPLPFTFLPQRQIVTIHTRTSTSNKLEQSRNLAPLQHSPANSPIPLAAVCTMDGTLCSPSPLRHTPNNSASPLLSVLTCYNVAYSY